MWLIPVWEEAGASLCHSWGAGVKSRGTPTDTGIRGAQRSHVSVQPARPHLRGLLRVSGFPELLRRSAHCPAPGKLPQPGSSAGLCLSMRRVAPGPPRPAEAALRGRRGWGAQERLAQAGRC